MRYPSGDVVISPLEFSTTMMGSYVACDSPPSAVSCVKDARAELMRTWTEFAEPVALICCSTAIRARSIS